MRLSLGLASVPSARFVDHRTNLNSSHYKQQLVHRHRARHLPSGCGWRRFRAASGHSPRSLNASCFPIYDHLMIAVGAVDEPQHSNAATVRPSRQTRVITENPALCARRTCRTKSWKT